MNESPWSEETAPAPKKGGVPAWAFWVGGGCLLLLLLVGIGGFFAVRFVKQAAEEWKDPEKQWESVRTVLPYDQRPTGVTFTFSWHLFGVDAWLFNDSHGYMVMLMQLPEKNAQQTREQLLDPSASRGLFGNFGRHGQQRLKLQVQGRELDALRFVQDMGSGGGSDTDTKSTGPGATLVVDLTAQDAVRPLVLQMTRANGGEEAFDEKAALDFLEPFHVGRQR
jgi:hypothetical protein